MSVGVRVARGEGRIGWLEQTLAGITGSIEQAIFSERLARLPGGLQALDPRAKLGMFLAMLLAAGLTGSVVILLALHAVVLAAARASHVPVVGFLRRTWLGIPLFAGVVVIPSLFLVPGPPLLALTLGPVHLAPSVPGVAGAVLLVARVGTSVSLAVLLVTTTPWADVLKALRAVRVPQLFVLVLSMTYRYIFLFLHTANGVLLARKSRVVGRAGGAEQRRWIGGTMGNLAGRAFRMSNDVYAAMMARGFTGEARTYATYRMRGRDWVALAATLALSAAAVAAGPFLP